MHTLLKKCAFGWTTHFSVIYLIRSHYQEAALSLSAEKSCSIALISSSKPGRQDRHLFAVFRGYHGTDGVYRGLQQP